MSTTAHKHAMGLEQAQALLAQGQPQKALEALNRTKDNSPWVENARGVCLMRLGQADRAVSIYRRLLLSSGVLMRDNAPTVFKVNFITALLLAGNTGGAISALEEIRQPDDPGVVRLRAAIGRWRKSLGMVQRILAAAGAPPAKPVVLDFPPGEA